MTIKFRRSPNHLSLNFIRPGVCIISFGLMYRHDPEENTRWIGPTPSVQWVDKHKVAQAMRTWRSWPRV